MSAVARPYERSTQASPTPAEAAGGPAAEGAPRVLVIDDSVATARALATILKRANYEPVVVHRGSDGITRARDSQPTGAGRFAAAVVDIHLPDLSGLVVSQQLREILGPETPIIVLSGDTSMPTLNSLPHVGATYFYSKPVNAGHLLDRLKEWVSQTP